MNSIRISLKYRIAIVFFLLAGLMIGLVLTMTLARSHEVNKQHLEKYKHVIAIQIADLCRVALFTQQFDDLQPYIEQSIDNPLTEKVMLADRRGIVVVSSNVLDIGMGLEDLIKGNSISWQIHTIKNASGRLGMLAILFTETQLDQANQEALGEGIKMAIISLIVIAVAGVLLGFLLTRRLMVLSLAAANIASGDLTARANLKGSDEVTLVGNTFDNMAERIGEDVNDLRKNEVQLKKARAELEHRVEQRTAELAIARDDALDASQTKSKFLASISHELRTPLNAILGYSELLLEDAIDNKNKDLQEDLEKINSAGSHLLSLINNVLDLSKIEAGKMPLNLEWFEIEPFLSDIIGSLHSLSSKSGNAIDLDCDEKVKSMYADKTKVRQILINLISNATKFAPNTKIRISVSHSYENGQEFLVYTVSDQGAGIHPDSLPNLFEEFSQLDPIQSNTQKGTGLGLAICQKYCSQMGGLIYVDSELGVGTTFTVKLPQSVTQK